MAADGGRARWLFAIEIVARIPLRSRKAHRREIRPFANRPFSTVKTSLPTLGRPPLLTCLTEEEIVAAVNVPLSTRMRPVPPTSKALSKGMQTKGGEGLKSNSFPARGQVPAPASEVQRGHSSHAAPRRRDRSSAIATMPASATRQRPRSHEPSSRDRGQFRPCPNAPESAPARAVATLETANDSAVTSPGLLPRKPSIGHRPSYC